MILGVTGAFGCGKSAVLSAFAARNWRTADADAICHELYAEPNGPLAKAFAERWGASVLAAEGTVNRKKVGEIVFADPEELSFLTDSLYPALGERLAAMIAGCREDKVNGVFEIPLLYEAGLAGCFDRVLAVWAEPGIRHRRLRESRNFSDGEIRLREARQLPADAKLERADYALINNGTVGELELQIDFLIHAL